MGITETCHLDSEKFELGGQFGAPEQGCATTQPLGHGVGHRVARSQQPVDTTADAGALTDGPDGGIRGAAGRVDDDATAGTDRKSGGTGQFVTGADTGGEDHQLGPDRSSVGEFHL